VRINSPGGDVFGAINIANALRAQKEKGRRVETIVDGLAASAATLVMMAGDVVKVADNAIVMVHNPWAVAAGNADDMRKEAEVLDEVRDAIIATYQWHAELSDKELKKLMDDETWMDADTAVELGFATEKVSGLRASSSISPRAMEKLKLKVPDQYKERLAQWTGDAPAPADALPVPPPAPPVPSAPAAVDARAALAISVEAGLDLQFAQSLVERGLPEADARAEAEKEKGRRSAESKRRDDISALCAKFKQGDLAPDFIAGGMTVAAAASVIAKVTALVDRVELDAGLNPDVSSGGAKRKANLNPKNIYSARTAQR